MDSVLTVLLKVKARMTDVRFFSDGVSAQGQHANNERTAMYDSLLTLSTMLLAKSRSYELQTPMQQGWTVKKGRPYNSKVLSFLMPARMMAGGERPGNV